MVLRTVYFLLKVVETVPKIYNYKHLEDNFNKNNEILTYLYLGFWIRQHFLVNIIDCWQISD